jgi:type IV secretion system protein VirB9
MPDADAMLRRLRDQYPNIEIPTSSDVIWVDSTGNGQEADIEAAMRQGAITTRGSVQGRSVSDSSVQGSPVQDSSVNDSPVNDSSVSNGAAAGLEGATPARIYPQAPDPFRVAQLDEDFDDEGVYEDYGKTDDREIRDARMARYWLDIREDLSLREVDRKALDLAEEFSRAKHAIPPTSLQGQNGALSYSYGDHIPRILCRPNHLTDISLQAGEKVTAVHAGDTARWQIAPATSGADGQETVHIVIKPLMPDIGTNLLVMTDRRTYNLDLLSSNESAFIPSVRFSYPADALNSWNSFIAENKKRESETLADSYALSPDDLHFDYAVTKGKELPWRPTRVFDDGVKTYIEMPAKYKSLEAPVLMFYEGSQLKLVNYRVKDRFYVADRIMTKKAVLMAGKSRVVIERRKESRNSAPSTEAAR